MRQKIARFRDLAARDNVLEPGKEIYEQIKGNWHAKAFANTNEIVLELGCGKGEYTVGLAKHFPNKNFIGVDIKGERIWIGSSQAIEQELTNAVFLRTKIELIDRFFEQGEIDEIWITFPDPRPKGRDEKRRLTSPRFLDTYKPLIKKEGKVHLITDNTPLFDYSLEVLQERTDVQKLKFTRNLYESEFNTIHKGIKTKYEKKHADLGEDIKYLQFTFLKN